MGIRMLHIGRAAPEGFKETGQRAIHLGRGLWAIPVEPMTEADKAKREQFIQDRMKGGKTRKEARRDWRRMKDAILLHR